MELFIGIDWASEDHDVYITNEVGKELDSFAIDDSLLGLETFNQKVEKHGISITSTSRLKHRMG